MSSETHSDDLFPLINGVRMPKLFDADLFRSGFQYQSKPDDIFIITYPRSGTHWMSVIVYSLLTNGQAFDKNIGDYFARMPFIDRYGKDAVSKMVRPGAIQTHYPFDRISYNTRAKYIVIIRHPKDVCVSCYRLFTENPEFGLFHMEFDTFFELFVTGQVPYNDYFEHLRLAWSHKDDDNVLLVSYEQMKQDLRGIIRQVDEFLGTHLINNEELIDQVETYASFDYMKNNFDSSVNAFRTQNGQAPKRSIEFISKGLVSNWTPYMNDKQSQRLDVIISEKTRNMTGLEALWSPSSDSKNE